MGAGWCVGRVGVLAVALGVGMGLSSVGSIAHADETGEDSASPAGPSAAASSTGVRGGVVGNRRDGGRAGSSADSVTASVDVRVVSERQDRPVVQQRAAIQGKALEGVADHQVVERIMPADSAGADVVVEQNSRALQQRLDTAAEDLGSLPAASLDPHAGVEPPSSGDVAAVAVVEESFPSTVSPSDELAQSPVITAAADRELVGSNGLAAGINGPVGLVETLVGFGVVGWTRKEFGVDGGFKAEVVPAAAPRGVSLRTEGAVPLSAASAAVEPKAGAVPGPAAAVVSGQSVLAAAASADPFGGILGVIQGLLSGIANAIQGLFQAVGKLFGFLGPVNHAPTATASVGAPSGSSGAVTVTVTGVDADGDSLSFSAPSSTAKGSIVNAGGGVFTYTPTTSARQNAAAPSATAADKQDTFTVAVTDGKGGTANVAVTVSILAAAVNHAPTAKVSVGSPNSSTGKVTGTVTGTDTDGDKLTYTVATKAAKGTATINAATGAFSYTPTGSARSKAGASSASASDKQDTFTVTVSDGRGGTVNVAVKVAVQPAAKALAWPLKGAITLNQTWANPHQIYTNLGQKGHNGLDLKASLKTPVYAAADGVVKFEGWGQNNGWLGEAAGISVLITHSSLGIVTGYAHLSSTVINVGQTVKQGQLIGYSGDTGLKTGPHLHFEVLPVSPNFKNGYAGRVDPRPYLPAV